MARRLAQRVDRATQDRVRELDRLVTVLALMALQVVALALVLVLAAV